MGAPGMEPAPATQMLGPLAMLSQQQQQQQMMLREAMKQQILRLVSMMPMANPAGAAARTEPLPQSMGEEGMMEDEASSEDMTEDQAEEMNY
jgi:hypothetical protein